MEQKSLVTTAAFWRELELITESHEKEASAAWKPAHIHKIAKHLGVDFNTEAFKAFSKQVTGKEHLDDMDRAELQKMAVALLRKQKIQEKTAAGMGMLKPLRSVPKPPTPTFLKPVASAANAVKVPGTVAAKAGTATNVEKLRPMRAVYG